MNVVSLFLHPFSRALPKLESVKECHMHFYTQSSPIPPVSKFFTSTIHRAWDKALTVSISTTMKQRMLQVSFRIKRPVALTSDPHPTYRVPVMLFSSRFYQLAETWCYDPLPWDFKYLIEMGLYCQDGSMTWFSRMTFICARKSYSGPELHLKKVFTSFGFMHCARTPATHCKIDSAEEPVFQK